jgi:NAD(P)-dependent dehydrogenase (short-subunit alcohol dehydrogenase family)
MSKTAFIIGASSGIGKATADMLRSRDWSIAEPTHKKLDMSSIASVDRYLKTVTHNGTPTFNAVVFSAGECLYDFERQFHINVTSQLLLIVRLLPVLYPDACVIAVASTRGFIGGVATMPYSVAKAAQIAMIQGLAREYGGAMRWNVVCPGWTDTKMGEIVKATGGVSNPNAVPQPAEAVARVIVQLIEDGSNGLVIRVVDGHATKATWTW